MAVVPSMDAFPGPGEIEGFWAFDKMHAPRPITPLSADLITPQLAIGFTEAQAEYDSPVAVSNQTINYYLYASFHPLTDEAELADRLSRYRQTLEDEVPGIGRRWDEEFKPFLIREVEERRRQDHTVLSDAELLERLDDYERHMIAQWRVHGHINFVLISSAKFCDFYDAELSPAESTESYQLLMGFHTRSVDASRGLWRLRALIKADPTLAGVFARLAPGELPGELEKTESGRQFLTELHGYLDEYGWRSDAVYDMADVTWREDPAIPLGALAGYVRSDDNADPDVLLGHAIARREELLAAARSKLAADPAKLATFESLYEAARYSTPVTEDHAFYIDQMGVATFRRFVLEIGRRLAERNQLNAADDVFYLHKSELINALTSGSDQRVPTTERRAEMAQWATFSPPPVLGSPRPPAEDPFMDALTVRLLGITPPSETPAEANVLRGVAGSPGVVTGTARVVRSLAEASVLDDGDIMVCEMTLPPWVPLFSIVSGVVTDTGGVLSHCAIVAREFGLPAVVGTVLGTKTIRDGSTITIDGTTGVVLLAP